jgi:DNA-binding MarR family transcriptional regulator
MVEIGMSAQLQLQKRTERDPLPDELNSPNAKLVYFYVDVCEETTIDDLQTCLGLQKLALFSVLDSLRKQGLVERDGDVVRTAA